MKSDLKPCFVFPINSSLNYKKDIIITLHKNGFAWHHELKASLEMFDETNVKFNIVGISYSFLWHSIEFLLPKDLEKYAMERKGFTIVNNVTHLIACLKNQTKNKISL